MGYIFTIVATGLLRAIETMGLLRAVDTMGLLRVVSSMSLIHGPITWANNRLHYGRKRARVGIVRSWADHNGSSLIGHI